MWPFRKRKKTALKNGMINLICTKCGASMDSDLEHIQVYCPFCSTELMIPAGYFKDLYEKIKKEET